MPAKATEVKVVAVSAENPGSWPKIAILIPCFNEELTVGNVVRQFRFQLPDALVYVFDNNSTDRTAEEAREAGAIVLHESRQGKGYVIQSMFRQELDADVYLLVDGDGQCPARSVHELIAPVLNDKADMVIGSRLHQRARSQFRLLNRLGNRLFLLILNSLFQVKLTDILSGYRAFSSRFVKDISVFARGFEAESELTIKALQRGHRIVEVPVNLGQRPPGSHSKIRIVRDGILILRTILALFRDYKPLAFFGAIGAAFILAGLVPGLIVSLEFLRTGRVLGLLSAVLAAELILSGTLLMIGGVIIHTIVRRFRELDHKLQALGNEVGRLNADRACYPRRALEDER